MNEAKSGVIDWHPTTRLVHGAGVLRQIGDLAAAYGRRALIVTDQGIIRAGHVERCVDLLRRAGLDAIVFDQVHENPTTADADKVAAFCRAASPDLLIGLGGGSSLDTAKACNFLQAGGGTMHDYRGTGRGRGRFLPFIAVPTTGGTGSEMQSYALISDAETRVKMACGDRRAAAALALLDPELTLTQPPRVTALTGLDAISHAIETWVCRKATTLSRMFSREAFRLLAGAFSRVLTEPESVAARADMQLGAALAGLAIENSMLGAAHGLANPLTAHFGIIHGQAVAITLPHVICFNAVLFESEYAALVAAAGWGPRELAGRCASDWLALRVARWARQAGLQTGLFGCGVLAPDTTQLAEDALQQWTTGFNPRPVTLADAQQLYGEMLRDYQPSPGGSTLAT